MHWIRQHRGGKTRYTALKLDMSMAYDRLEWSFLEAMMVKLGFDNIWVNLIMRYVSSISYSFLLNGEVRGSLEPGRGIRQEDLLSPYLFVICAHGLSTLLWDFEQRKLFKDCYSHASSQSIKFDKSALSFSSNTTVVDREALCTLFEIFQVDGHDLYLGLPTFSMRTKRIQFSYIRDRVTRKLHEWKEKNFSHGGKEVLIKYVIQAISTYAMSCFIIPYTIIKEIEAACAIF
ncbi:hypothetical protein UlMin_028020 [Ulmus minor]